jgi:hypothetical protein
MRRYFYANSAWRAMTLAAAAITCLVFARQLAAQQQVDPSQAPQAVVQPGPDQSIPEYNGAGRAHLGVTLGDNNQGKVWIRAVDPGSAADVAGLRPNDQITALDDRQIFTYLDVMRYINTKGVSDDVVVKIRRNGKDGQLTAALGASYADDGPTSTYTDYPSFTQQGGGAPGVAGPGDGYYQGGYAGAGGMAPGYPIGGYAAGGYGGYGMPAIPTAAAIAANPQARYAWYGNQWWYYGPNNQWSVWANNRWNSPASLGLGVGANATAGALGIQSNANLGTAVNGALGGRTARGNANLRSNVRTNIQGVVPGNVGGAVGGTVGGLLGR